MSTTIYTANNWRADALASAQLPQNSVFIALGGLQTPAEQLTTELPPCYSEGDIIEPAEYKEISPELTSEEYRRQARRFGFGYVDTEEAPERQWQRANHALTVLKSACATGAESYELGIVMRVLEHFSVPTAFTEERWARISQAPMSNGKLTTTIAECRAVQLCSGTHHGIGEYAEEAFGISAATYTAVANRLENRNAILEMGDIILTARDAMFAHREFDMSKVMAFASAVNGLVEPEDGIMPSLEYVLYAMTRQAMDERLEQAVAQISCLVLDDSIESEVILLFLLSARSQLYSDQRPKLTLCFVPQLPGTPAEYAYPPKSMLRYCNAVIFGRNAQDFIITTPEMLREPSADN